MGRHKIKKVSMSADENSITSAAGKFNTKNIEAVFMEYGGNDRCVRCNYAEDELCKYVKCCESERKDGRRGYFRAANISVTEQSF